MIEQSDEQVWITRTGKRFYPRKNNTADICVTLSEALERGLSPSREYNVQMRIKAKKEKELQLRREKAEADFGTINTFIFSKKPCKRKLDVVNKLEESRLLEIELSTIKRMLMQAGRINSSYGKSRYFRLRDKPGNHYNSIVESVSLYKDKPYISIYVQCDDTDTSINELMGVFFANNEYKVSVIEYDKYGDPHTHYFTYLQHERAEVIRSILREYIYHKYPEQFK